MWLAYHPNRKKALTGTLFLSDIENTKDAFSVDDSFKITKIKMKLILLKDYFRAQMIYTCFQRRLGNKKLCANLKTFSKTFPVWQLLLL